jgi:hypothetical protein
MEEVKMKNSSVATHATNSLVERAARAAMRGRPDDEPDLLTEGFPFEPALWMIVIEPIKPRELSDGNIVTVGISQEAEEFQITVGRVLKAGPGALDGKTTAGLELSKFLPGINTPEQLIGKYVIYKRHVGQDLILRKTGQTIKVMVVTDLLGVTSDPNAWKFYI